MTLWSTNYKGYTIHTDSTAAKVTYQSPAWPDDPRIVKAPSLETAKRWIREEISRIERHGRSNVVYLAKGEVVQGSPGKGYRHVRYVWLIIDADEQDLVQPAFGTKDEARAFANKRGWALLEHFDY